MLCWRWGCANGSKRKRPANRSPQCAIFSTPPALREARQSYQPRSFVNRERTAAAEQHVPTISKRVRRAWKPSALFNQHRTAGSKWDDTTCTQRDCWTSPKRSALLEQFISTDLTAHPLHSLPSVEN